MKKFLPFSKRQPSMDRNSLNKSGWSATDRFGARSIRRTSASSINTRTIQVVRGAYNIDLNKVDSSFTKLHRACLLNDEIQVKKYIHKIDNNSPDSSSRYPIHLATVNGNSAILKLLIDNQADPNVQDNDGNTPLIKSIECGHEHLVKYLLDNSADPNLSDLENNTATHWALSTESLIALEALFSSRKCDLSSRNNKDETCLHLAVRSPHINLATFELLIKDGSDLEARDQLGLKAIDIAQACDNQIAMKAFELCNVTDNRTPEPETANNHIIDNETNLGSTPETPNTKQANVRKMCDEYKRKYITKSKENLEYEKKLIQLTAQIERLTIDMSYMREHIDKIERDYDQLSAKNSELEDENRKLVKLLQEEKKFKDGENSDVTHGDGTAMQNGLITRRENYNKDLKVESADSVGHEDFVIAKAFLQERINKLKYGLTTTQSD